MCADLLCAADASATAAAAAAAAVLSVVRISVVFVAPGDRGAPAEGGLRSRGPGLFGFG